MSEKRKTPLNFEPVEPQQCSLEMRLEILSQVPFFSMLTGRDMELINRQFTERGYLPQEVVYYSGDPAERLYVVADGYIKLMEHSESGKNVLLDILVPGETLGSLSTLPDDEYQDTAQAQIAACVLSIEKNLFRNILEKYPAVTLALLDVTHSRLRAARERVRQLSALPAEKRLVHTLLKLVEKLGKESDHGLLINVPLSREDLAQMTGTTTETTSRVLSQLQKEGLIQSGRQWIAVQDYQQLQKLVIHVL
jgi:CRP/FNR family transcriptional regulator, nitrogen oxide reductase regulator